MKHPELEISRRVGVCGCKHTTRDLIRALVRGGYEIDHCITIGPQLAEIQRVAGYCDLRPFLEQLGVPYTIARSYSLESQEDRHRIPALQLDMLLVTGWQRLIPPWLLGNLAIGAFGMHGSFKPLPHGRGRSPMNWSLILNRTEFFTHLFRYSPTADDGPVVGEQIFSITPHDTAKTLHYKNVVAMSQLCLRHLPDLIAGHAKLRAQPQEGICYFPKRTEEDGLVYWSDTVTDIYNLIRAVTRPFHGAYTYLDDDEGKKVVLWRAIPFDTHLRWPGAAVGEVIEVFDGGELLVRAGDFTLLVQEFQGVEPSEELVGRRFGHLGIPRKNWGELPR
ncbi:MAG TPA: formyltransferase family protein [Longimicrobiales bacterium]|nr:formyltransferase family protein [Longimicrobiales bacterium]